MPNLHEYRSWMPACTSRLCMSGHFIQKKYAQTAFHDFKQGVKQKTTSTPTFYNIICERFSNVVSLLESIIYYIIISPRARMPLHQGPWANAYNAKYIAPDSQPKYEHQNKSGQVQTRAKAKQAQGLDQYVRIKRTGMRSHLKFFLE